MNYKKYLGWLIIGLVFLSPLAFLYFTGDPIWVYFAAVGTTAVIALLIKIAVDLIE